LFDKGKSMPKRIIYQTESGGVALVTPSMNCGLTVEEIARKDVPAGARYAILDTADVPTDFTFFNAWEVENSALNDGVGIGTQSWFIEQYEAEIATINAEPIPARLPDEQQTVEEYDAVVAQWEASKATRIAQLNTQIATQQAEMNA
jgi:hypothetical protein